MLLMYYNWKGKYYSIKLNKEIPNNLNEERLNISELLFSKTQCYEIIDGEKSI